MCSDSEKPSPGAYLGNLRAPMPLGRKARLVLRNVMRRVVPRPSACCGHPGEPGC